ncbi:MAG TPA: hypothetical protein DCM05_13685 [Elusimicrobia bacterium]|nr:MAG: hypothetical protein A3J82_01745 [Elusimicrobia bacterium RIFOXYA2_FULL_69_6]HAH07547.1 hypothetical protein [Elusimicrobiota bacterium]
MQPATGSPTAPAALEKAGFAAELKVRLQSLNAAFLAAPFLAYPRRVTLHGRRCPQCSARHGGLAQLRCINDVVQAQCRGCGFGVDLFWVPTN